MRPEWLALLAHHAETMPAGRFQDPPGTDFLDLAGAEFLQAVGFGIDIVAFDIQMDAGSVLHFLQQQHRFVGCDLERGVFAVAVIVVAGDRFAERLAPEVDGSLQVLDLAVEDERRCDSKPPITGVIWWRPRPAATIATVGGTITGVA